MGDTGRVRGPDTGRVRGVETGLVCGPETGIAAVPTIPGRAERGGGYGVGGIGVP